MTSIEIQRQPCLSDGAVASMRLDLGNGCPVLPGYVALALDEIEGLRAQVAELEVQNEMLSGVNKDQADGFAKQNVRVEVLEAAVTRYVEERGCCPNSREVRFCKESDCAFCLMQATVLGPK